MQAQDFAKILKETIEQLKNRNIDKEILDCELKLNELKIQKLKITGVFEFWNEIEQRTVNFEKQELEKKQNENAQLENRL
jgi:hypothetical protein